MLGDLGINQFAPMRLQRGEGAFLIRADEAAIPSHVSGKNGG